MLLFIKGLNKLPKSLWFSKENSPYISFLLLSKFLNISFTPNVKLDKMMNHNSKSTQNLSSYLMIPSQTKSFPLLSDVILVTSIIYKLDKLDGIKVYIEYKSELYNNLIYSSLL